VLIKKDDFISKAITTIKERKSIGIVGIGREPLPAKNLFEAVINFSATLQLDIYYKLNNQQNLYLCAGAARVFTREFAKKFRWPKVVNEDTYSYLACIAAGYKFFFENGAVVYYKSPDNFTDHLRQSLRFQFGRMEMKKHFPEELVESSYRLPRKLLLKSLSRYFFRNPVLFIGTVLVMLKTRMFWKRGSSPDPLWVAAASSKRLN